jgi:hypothetical protein
LPSFSTPNSPLGVHEQDVAGGDVREDRVALVLVEEHHVRPSRSAAEVGHLRDGAPPADQHQDDSEHDASRERVAEKHVAGASARRRLA